MISDDRMEKALRFLAETDDELAEAEADLLRAEKLVEKVTDKIFLTSDGSVADRKARASVSSELAPLEESQIQALVKHRQIKAKRDTEKLVIEVWRTYQANRRMGQ
jgi:hypothetical protein